MKTLLLAGAALCVLSANAKAGEDETTFSLVVSPSLANTSCLGSPTAKVNVKRGELNDRLKIRVTGLNPNLAFDLFTVQRSNADANGNLDPNFKGSFGLAWYQTDLQADGNGNAKATIQTILLDQIFGFDPDVSLPPTNTFHVGFWFNNPEDAKGCGFDPTKPTPFNGEHKAGPLAMISTPNPDTGLGPLCLKPNSDGTCNP
jgi:hypothetical protein